MQYALFFYFFTSVKGRALRRVWVDWQVDGNIDYLSSWYGAWGCVLQEFKHGIVFVGMLLRN